MKQTHPFPHLDLYVIGLTINLTRPHTHAEALRSQRDRYQRAQELLEHQPDDFHLIQAHEATRQHAVANHLLMHSPRLPEYEDVLSQQVLAEQEHDDESVPDQRKGEDANWFQWEDEDKKWFQRVYHVLRSYYGKFGLPPFEALYAEFYEGATDALLLWSDWIVAQTGLETPTCFWPADEPPFFATVCNPQGGQDLWMWFPDSSLEIWFRQEMDDKQNTTDMIETVLIPLLRTRNTLGYAKEAIPQITVSSVLNPGPMRTMLLEDLLNTLGTNLSST